jgi:CRISPR-associated protein Csx14
MSIQIVVEPTNPGQFFACCGLLELADRLWPGAEGWFARGDFHIACEGNLQTLLAILVMDPPSQPPVLPTGLMLLGNGIAVKPLIAPLSLSFDGGATISLTLDSWMTFRVEKEEVAAVANPPWNFWSGQQTPLRIWNPVRAALARLLTTLDSERTHRVFEQREFLTGRFGFDPGPAWNALDVGFSPNEQGISVESSPAVELLASIGLQRFRPRMGESRDSFDYSTWGYPLPPSVAAAATTGTITCEPCTRYRGRVISRGQYAALGYSTIFSGGSDE